MVLICMLLQNLQTAKVYLYIRIFVTETVSLRFSIKLSEEGGKICLLYYDPMYLAKNKHLCGTDHSCIVFLELLHSNI